jgi:hypothetical protein
VDTAPALPAWASSHSRHKCKPARQLKSSRISAREQPSAATGRNHKQCYENDQANPPQATWPSPFNRVWSRVA